MPTETICSCPPVMVIGDQVAGGIAVAMPESGKIFKEGIGLSNSGLKNLILSDLSYRDMVGSEPWIVIAVGTNDTGDIMRNAIDLRRTINCLAERHPNYAAGIIWVLPMNNDYVTCMIKSVAKAYGDRIVDIPDYVDTQSETVTQKPVYYPFPWSQIFGAQTVWYTQSISSACVTKQWFTDDKVIPNQAGYEYAVKQLRKLSNDWSFRPEPPPAPYAYALCVNSLNG